MEELSSMWNYQEDLDDLKKKRKELDELKLMVQNNITEIETLRKEANERKREHHEEVQDFLNLIKLARQERDEAMNQLRNFTSKLAPHHHHHQFEVNPIAAAKPVTFFADQSNSLLSDTYNQQQQQNSHGCSNSPVDSLFDRVTSPDFSKTTNLSTKMMGFVNQRPNVSMVTTGIDAVIDDLAKGKTLPQKGNLLQAVMEAGPLLETLMVAGRVPKWRNPPPPLMQTFKIPPLPIKAAACVSLANPNRTIGPQKRLNHCSTSMLDFASSGFSNSQALNTGGGAGVKGQVTGVKRRKVSMS